MERHNERRSKLCVVCCSYAKPMTPKFANLVETFLIEGYNIADIRLPSGLCSTCCSHLGRIGRGDFKYNLPNFFDYSNMASYRIPRHGECNCVFCVMCPVSGRFGAKTTRGSVKKAKSKKAPKKDSSRLCPRCLSPIFVGCQHLCTKTSKVQNIVRQLSEKTKKRVAYEILKEDLAADGSSSVSTPGKPFNLNLSMETLMEMIPGSWPRTATSWQTW